MNITDDYIKEKINLELEKVERNFKKVKPKLYNEGIDLIKGEFIDTDIPGFNKIQENKPEVADFIAFVLDIRESTKHLTIAISANASLLERVVYETTAINTAGLLIVNEFEGSITEFLGDGFLALFKIPDNENIIEREESIRIVNRCAAECIRVNAEIIGPILKSRYKLPPLAIGIGLGYSRAIVTTIGFGNNLHPKAIGECVFRASKNSKGKNTVRIDEALKIIWPKSKGGKIRFGNMESNHGFKSYQITSTK